MQEKLYRRYLDLYPPPAGLGEAEIPEDLDLDIDDSTAGMRRSQTKGPAGNQNKRNRNVRIFGDFQKFLRICTHPYALRLQQKRDQKESDVCYSVWSAFCMLILSIFGSFFVSCSSLMMTMKDHMLPMNLQALCHPSVQRMPFMRSKLAYLLEKYFKYICYTFFNYNLFLFS